MLDIMIWVDLAKMFSRFTEPFALVRRIVLHLHQAGLSGSRSSKNSTCCTVHERRQCGLRLQRHDHLQDGAFGPIATTSLVGRGASRAKLS